MGETERPLRPEYWRMVNVVTSERAKHFLEDVEGRTTEERLTFMAPDGALLALVYTPPPERMHTQLGDLACQAPDDGPEEVGDG